MRFHGHFGGEPVLNPDKYVPSTYELTSAIPAETERLIEDVRAALQPGMDMWERRDIYAQFAQACDKEFGLFTPIEELFGRQRPSLESSIAPPSFALRATR